MLELLEATMYGRVSSSWITKSCHLVFKNNYRSHWHIILHSDPVLPHIMFHNTYADHLAPVSHMEDPDTCTLAANPRVSDRLSNL